MTPSPDAPAPDASAPDGGQPARHVAGTAPYAWPYDGRIEGRHLALVLAGWDVAWAARAHADDPAAHDVAVFGLAEAVHAVGGLVLVVTHGAAPAPLVPDPTDAGVTATAVAAAGVDGFHGSPLDTVLRASGRTHLLVAGHGIEGPVHSTLRSANDRGYECLLVTDACTHLVPDLAAPAAHTVTMSGGIFGAVGTTAPVLAALAPT